ncbi:response regulator [Psychrobacter sp. 1U2]|uniref:response regulator n=1 Tax=Psychrobacter sp. 1U2 TaxID=3453577 RepID=UPI003F46715F
MELKHHSERRSLDIFNNLQYDVTEYGAVTNDDIENILKKPYIQDISYQLIFMLPSGQTYIYNHTRANETALTAVSFRATTLNAKSSYQLDNQTLRADISLEGGYQLYLVLRHQIADITWTSYRYWLPLMAAIILFMIALLYTLRRQANWQQLLLYTDTLSEDAKEAYTSIPFPLEKTTSEFLRLGHALSRIKYQLHHDYRRIKTLKHRLERLVDGAPLPMLMITRQGQISFFNPRFEQVFATAFQSEVTYSLSDFLTGSDKATQQLLLDISAQRVTRTLLVCGLENNQLYQLHLSPWFGAHGQVRGFTALLNNVNSFMKQCEDLRLKNHHLESQAKSFTELRSVISHELRTPLNAIISTLDMVDKDNLTTAQHETLTILTQSSHAMLTMLNDMLDMAKIEAGRVDIINESADIFKLGQHVSDMMIGSTRRRDIDLLYYFAPCCPRYITTDGQRLCQILLNLMDNAVKFTDSGYVALIVEEVTPQELSTFDQNLFSTPSTAASIMSAQDFTPEASTSSSLADTYASTQDSPECSWVRFRVKDTGIGITATEQQQLFSYFNQANPQITQKFGGTGLGLAISKSFAQLLGGFIHVKSAAACGSIFDLYIPCHAPIYQPVYHFHHSLLRIHLIAVVDQALRETYLQRIGSYLSMTISVYSELNPATIAQLEKQLTDSKPGLTPILLLDYERYDTYNNESISALNIAEVPSGDEESPPLKNKPSDTFIEANSTLTALINNPQLSKILLSRKPERGIPSTFLEKFDGFLNKPINITLMVSELIRLSQLQPAETAQRLGLSLANLETDKTHQAAEKLATKDDRTHSKAVEQTLAKANATAPMILVVEDNPINQKITCKLLAKLNYRSIVAENGEQALAVLKKHRQEIALILMDCRMPVMDGLEATQTIRSTGDDITIIALTANDSTEDRISCQQVGMDEFLTKPVQKDKLQNVLQRFIS